MEVRFRSEERINWFTKLSKLKLLHFINCRNSFQFSNDSVIVLFYALSMHSYRYDRTSHWMFLDALKLFDGIIIPLSLKVSINLFKIALNFYFPLNTQAESPSMVSAVCGLVPEAHEAHEVCIPWERVSSSLWRPANEEAFCSHPVPFPSIPCQLPLGKSNCLNNPWQGDRGRITRFSYLNTFPRASVHLLSLWLPQPLISAETPAFKAAVLEMVSD